MEKLIAFLKKPITLIVIACILVAAIAIGVIVAVTGGNGNDTDTEGGTSTETGATDTDGSEPKTYTVSIITEGGMVMSGIGVYLYTDETLSELIWFAETNEDGTAAFENVTESSPVAVLKGVTEGYDVADSYKLTEESTTLTLASAVISDTSLDGVSYGLGDVIRDFTVTTPEGEEYTISALLEEKDAVVLNFWYIECQPCAAEFPYLQEAYETYGDNIAVLALNPENKSDDEIAAFKADNGLTFPMAQCGTELKTAMELTMYPTTVVIDRYGVITLIEKGTVTSADLFLSAFAYYSAEDYKQSLVADIESLLTEDETEVPMGTEENPIELGGITEFDAEVPAGEKLYYHIYKVSGMKMTVSDPDVYVIYDGKTYQSENGEISFVVTSADTFTPVVLAIGNSSSADKTFAVTFSNLEGTSANPYPLEMGQFDTAIEADNDQGVYYTFTATENGTVTVYNVSATDNVGYDYVLYNLTSYANRTLLSDGATDENGVASVSVAVSAGDLVTLTVATTPDENNAYPAADLTSYIYFTPSTEPDGETGGETGGEIVEDKVEYTIYVVDEKGKGISGVKLTVTADGAGASLTTDKNGKAVTEQKDGEYTVTLTLPSGYTSDATKFKLKSGATELTITLQTKKNENSSGGNTSGGNTSGGDSSGGTTAPKNVSYSVTVVDGSGKGQSGVTVKFMKNGSEVASGTTDGSGKLTKTLEEGSYSVILSGTSKLYDEKSAVLTASKTSLKICVADKVGNESVTIYPSGDEYEAIILSTGHAYTDITYGSLNYFIFEPTKSGVYSFTTSNANAQIGYYGGTWFVQSVNVAENYDSKTNTFTMNVKESSLGNVYIIGVDALTDSVGGCVISITRTGDAILGPEDMPWTVYETTSDLDEYRLDLGATLKYIDITAKTSDVSLVYNSSDGYYHYGSENGPVVLVMLGEDAPYVSFAKAISTTGIGVYCYDNKGNFSHKVDYTECLYEYSENMDPNRGVYPLTDDLILIYKNYGDYADWYDSSSQMYLFSEVSGVNKEISWMFALCYAE